MAVCSALELQLQNYPVSDIDTIPLVFLSCPSFCLPIMRGPVLETRVINKDPGVQHFGGDYMSHSLYSLKGNIQGTAIGMSENGGP